MVTESAPNMGQFSVNVELSNFGDIVRAAAGDISANQIRQTTRSGVVDSGAPRPVIPQATADELGLLPTGETTVRYADQRTARRPMVTGIQLAYGGRRSVFDALIEPDRDTALIGAIVLEALDLLSDRTRQAVVPRDPNPIISEVE